MSSPVMTIKPIESLETAARYMLENKVRHLLVINGLNQPLGIITASDFTSYVRENSDDEISG
jgi:CBS domain-containing protein